MILVTGATGFLGHHLIPQLQQANYKIRALVRPSSNTTFLQQVGVELAYANDITDSAAVQEAVQGCTAVVHAAGLFRFWGKREWFWQTNVQGTETMLAAAQKAGVQRFIHISTIAVVGKTPAGEITETTPCQPLDAYQESKLAAEKAVLTTWQQHGLPVVILRPGAFYGPWGHYAFNRLFFEEPLRGWRIKIHGGRHITFPVYVPDVAQGVVLALSRGQGGEVYNISGRSHSHNEINQIVSDLAGISRWRLNVPKLLVLGLAQAWTAVSQITHKEPFYPVNMAPYVFQDWRVNTEKAQQQLGFMPTPFIDGARQTLAWYHQIL
ncbi:MAG: NAD-dependent epimerase/dehydratase family protein [Candidatus Promineifilaceae bacterium]